MRCHARRGRGQDLLQPVVAEAQTQRQSPPLGRGGNMKLDPYRILFGVILTLTLGTTQAAVQTKAVTYDDHGTKLTGHLYWDDAQAGKRPGVVVYHEWWG